MPDWLLRLVVVVLALAAVGVVCALAHMVSTVKRWPAIEDRDDDRPP